MTRIDHYAAPPLECDIVMKGGITSGVIYPRAVAELARTYRLRSVGGASAGAIAAAAAAAAELGRAEGGFEELDTLPRDLTAPGPDGRSTLSTLFQPTRTAAPLFRLLGAVGDKEGAAKGAAVVGGLLRGYWWAALLGALPGLALVVLGALGTGTGRVAGIIGGVLLLLVGVVVGVALAAGKTLGRVASDGFGMCTGMPGVDSGAAPALTPWLHAKVQSLARRAPDAPPVTFGQLDDAGVELRMMTTNLTRHQPMAMPWRSHEYFFDPQYLRTLFPDDVVDWMVAHPPAAGGFSSQLLRAQAGNLRPWPDARDLPVVVATRMSLSFPVLIQAVRLAAVDYGQPGNRDAREAVSAWRREHRDGTVEQALAELQPPEFSPVWFTDGGLCANLPVHFFDSPLPKHPTFALNLGPFPPGRSKRPDERANSYLPTVNQGGATRGWFPLPTDGLGAWGGFAGIMLHTAREWVDAGQMTMPGYRDRIVTVHHTASEGGMNLDMPHEVVSALAERGRQAAGKLVAAFGPTGDAWTNHQWIRMRTSTAGLSGWMAEFLDSYRSPQPVPYPNLAGEGADAELPSYSVGVGDRWLVNQHVDELVDLARSWGGDDALAKGAPSPRPQLRLVPDDGTAEGLSE